MELKPGEVVRVYYDPVTCKDQEGLAKLVKQIRPDHGDGLSLWRVIFAGEDAVMGIECTRTINNES